jgi:serine/threonine protein kinase
MSGSKYAIVMEFHPMSLRDFLKNKRLNDLAVKQIAEQIGQAINWCHSQRVVHLDLKTANIVQDPEDTYLWKLIDFGSAKEIGEKVSGGVTIKYAAPELALSVMTKSQILANPFLDMWSFGCVIYELIVGKHFLDNDNISDYTEIVASKKFNKNTHLISNEQGRYICEKLLSFDPEVRGQMSNFLGNAFIVSGNNTEQNVKSKNNDVKIDLLINKVSAVHDMTAKILDQIISLRATVIDLADSPVPRTFIIIPATNEGFWKKMSHIGQQKFTLHLLCEASDCTHINEDHSGYEILNPSKFLKATGPLIALSAKILRASLDCVLPGLGGALNEMFSKIPLSLNPKINVQKHLHFCGTKLSDYLDTLSKVVCDFSDKTLSDAGSKQVSGPALRELQEFLKVADPKNELGQLERVVIQKGGVLWLCKYHANEVKKSTKDVPNRLF